MVISIRHFKQKYTLCHNGATIGIFYQKNKPLFALQISLIQHIIPVFIRVSEAKFKWRCQSQERMTFRTRVVARKRFMRLKEWNSKIWLKYVFG